MPSLVLINCESFVPRDFQVVKKLTLSSSNGASDGTGNDATACDSPELLTGNDAATSDSPELLTGNNAATSDSSELLTGNDATTSDSPELLRSGGVTLFEDRK